MKVSTFFAGVMMAIFAAQAEALKNTCRPGFPCMDQVWDMSKIQYFFTSSIVEAELLMIALALLFGMGICCMMSLQVNPVLAEKSINWGKIEEVEG